MTGDVDSKSKDEIHNPESATASLQQFGMGSEEDFQQAELDDSKFKSCVLFGNGQK